MSIITSIKKWGFVFLVGSLAVACDYAPPPKPVVEGAAANSAVTKTTAVARPGSNNLPGAVLSEKSIAPVNDLEISQPDGKKFKFADLKGKVVLVDIWATFCPPCREQAPKLAALNKKYQDQGLAVVGLSIDEEKDQDLVKMFMKQAGINYTVAYAGEKISRAFLDGTEDETGQAPIPQLFVISRDGRLVEHLIGNDPRHSMARLEEIISQQLN